MFLHRLRSLILGRIPQKECFSSHNTRGLVIFTQLIAGDFNLDHVVKLGLPVKLLFLPFHALFLSSKSRKSSCTQEDGT